MQYVRKCFYLAVLLVAALPCKAQLPVSDSLLLRETDHDNSYIFSLGERGFILVYYTAPILEEKKEWHWVHYDIHLKKLRDSIIDLPKKIRQVGCLSDDGTIFYFFSLKANSTEARVWSYNIKRQSLQSFALYAPGSIWPEKMIHTGNYLYLDVTTGSTLNENHEVGKINLLKQKFELLKHGRKGTVPVSSDLEINHSTGHLFLLTRQDDRKGSVLTVRVFDSVGTAISDFIRVPVSEGREPSTGYLLWENDSTFMIAGTYRYDNSGAKYGLYSCQMNFKKSIHTTFMSFTQFDNFYNHLSESDRTIKLEARNEEIQISNNSYSWANLMEHGFVRVDSMFYFTAENYRIYTYEQDHSIPLNNGSVDWTSTETEGYSSEAMLVAALTWDGKLVWNQMAPISGSSVLYPKQKICVFQSDEDLLRGHILLYDSYSTGTFRKDGSGFETTYTSDRGARVAKDEKFEGYLNEGHILSPGKMLVVGRMGSRPDKTFYLKTDPVLVFYVLTLF